MKFTFFSGVIPLEKVKIMKSCGILILEKTENCLESVLNFIKAKRLISFQKSNGSSDKIFTNRLKKTDE